jgi:hypothetical protein
VSAGHDRSDEIPPALRVPAWNGIAGLAHGFFGRRGGVSGGPFASLNLSEWVGDDPAAVAANSARVALALPRLSFVALRQVHGARVMRVERGDSLPAEADGMIARAAGIGLALLTADCVPILCVAAAAHAAMALHAGWRGTLAGIAAAGLDEARRWFDVAPDAWQVALGPAIDGCCYEVEASIGQQLIDRWGAMPDAWQRAGSHGQLDLRAANRHVLRALGVPEARIARIGPCTSCRNEAYFSHRRSGGRAGRQVSVIGWDTPVEGAAPSAPGR